VPLMVVGRATEARPAANFHTRCFSSFFLRTSLPNPFLCSSEVGAEFDYCLVSQVKRVIIGARFSDAKFNFVSSLEGLLSYRKPCDVFQSHPPPFLRSEVS
jgi:hypothetical protein